MYHSANCTPVLQQDLLSFYAPCEGEAADSKGREFYGKDLLSAFTVSLFRLFVLPPRGEGGPSQDTTHHSTVNLWCLIKKRSALERC